MGAQAFAYLTTLGKDTLALERYERTGDDISGDYVTVVGGILIHHYVVHVAASGMVDRMSMTVRRRDATPLDTLGFSLTGDTATLFNNRWPDRTRRLYLPGVFPMFVGVNALEETAVSYARTKRRDSLTIPIVAVWANFDTAHFRVIMYSADSIGLWSRVTPGLLKLDRDGHVLVASARLTSTRTETIRVPPFDLARVLRSFPDTPATANATAFATLSPRDSVSSSLGNARVRIAYGRPSLRGRDVFAHGVLGDSIWRTGANESTEFSTDQDLRVSGAVLPAGRYTLWTRVAPGNSAYALVFSAQRGADCLSYRRQDDVLEIPLHAAGTAKPLERLTIAIEPQSDGESQFVLRWGANRTLGIGCRGRSGGRDVKDSAVGGDSARCLATSDVSIPALVDAAKDGDDVAFAELVRRCQDTAVAYAASILRDYDLAEDAAQDAFVDAYRLMTSLRDSGTCVSWFRTIVFKHSHRYQRRQQRFVPISSVGDIATNSESIDDRLERSEQLRAVREAVASLPPGERSVILLFYMAEQSQASIAEFLDLKVNTVKTRLYSARRRLRAIMGDMLERSLREERPSNGPRFLRRIIASALPIQVYSVDPVGRPISVGAAISARSAEAPATPIWFIEPRATMTSGDWPRLLDLMRSMKIPGLAGGSQLTDDVLKQVRKIEHLTYLDLSDSRQVTDRGLAHLSECRYIEHLDVSGTSISDAGLTVLRSFPNLRVFEARHLDTISDAGITHLGDAKRLERVNLMGTPTGDGAILALRNKGTLRELFLGNLVTDAGLPFLADVPSFATWSPRRVEMSLLSAQIHGTFLWLNLASKVTNKGLKSFGQLPGLVGLSLFGSGSGAFDDSGSRVTPAGLEAFSTLEHLAWLGCTSRLCDDEAMRRVARIPGLRFLMCQDTIAGDDGFGAVAESSSIEFIWGRRSNNLTAAGFARLSGMPQLRGLAVGCRNVGERGLQMLPDFERLTEFMPIGVVDDGFRHIGRCERLEALHCMYCPTITDRATELIGGLPHLREYQAWGTQATDQTLCVLGTMRSIEQVRFTGCLFVTDAGLPALAQLPNLKSVALEGLPGVTVEGAAALPPHVRVNYAP